MLYSFRANFKSVLMKITMSRLVCYLTYYLTKTWILIKCDGTCRDKLVSLVWWTSVFPLQDLEVFNWSAGNLISNKTRCSVSPVVPLWAHRNVCCSAAGHWSGDPQVFCPGLHGSLHCLPCSLMTLQVLHAANELMDQAIDQNVANSSSKHCRKWLREKYNSTVEGRDVARYAIQMARCHVMGWLLLDHE